MYLPLNEFKWTEVFCSTDVLNHVRCPIRFFMNSWFQYYEIWHTIYTRNNMGQKCEGNCGLWVLNEILKKTYPENLKKILGAVWDTAKTNYLKF